MRLVLVSGYIIAFLSSFQTRADDAVEFCLAGELDLGTRLQGYRPQPGEWVETTWCVVTEDDSQRVYFSAAGKPNPDVDGGWSVLYGPPGDVRIVRDGLPDLLFHDSNILSEAMQVRRMDPRRLADELKAAAGNNLGFQAIMDRDRVSRVETAAHMPIRGPVDVVWSWNWSEPDHPTLQITVAGLPLFRARGTWTTLSDAERLRVLHPAADESDIRIPGSEWPATVDMNLIELSDTVFVVDGVRSGFRHMVVRTGEGLLVADAPASWVEFHPIPPTDLVPGFEGPQLSESLIEFLEQSFPNEEIIAVALTHFHDDHAGGAGAFAMAGADVYMPGPAPEQIEAMLAKAHNAIGRPNRRKSKLIEVVSPLRIPELDVEIALIPIKTNPHVEDMLGVLVPSERLFFVSDIHVPRGGESKPTAERAGTECWFAEWAVANLPAGTRVINSHSDGTTELAVLAGYLKHPVCGSQET